jgi:anti-sigma B factor antagonist
MAAAFALERVEHAGEPVVVLRLLGEHDLASAEELRDRLSALRELEERVVVDLSMTDFIDSSVLNELIRADRALQDTGRRLVLRYGTTAVVRRILELSGLLERLPHAASQQEAVALVGTPAGAHEPRS